MILSTKLCLALKGYGDDIGVVSTGRQSQKKRVSYPKTYFFVDDFETADPLKLHG